MASEVGGLLAVRNLRQEVVPYSVRQREDEARRAKVLAQRQAERDAKRVGRKLNPYDPVAVAKKRTEQIAAAKRRRDLAKQRETFGRPETDDDDGAESPPPPSTDPPETTTARFFPSNSPSSSSSRGGGRDVEVSEDVVVVHRKTNRVVAKIQAARVDAAASATAKEEADDTFQRMLRGGGDSERVVVGDPDKFGDAPPRRRPCLLSKKKSTTKKFFSTTTTTEEEHHHQQKDEPPLLPPTVLEARRRAVLDEEFGRLERRPRSGQQKNQPQRPVPLRGKNNSRGGHAPRQPPTPLCVRRDRERRARETAIDPKTDVETRRCLDKRTARLKYAEDFAAAVLAYRRSLAPSMSSSLKLKKLSTRVVVRVRPLLKHEASRGEFVSVSGDLDEKSVVVHHCTMHADMVRLQHAARTFPCSRSLASTATDDDAYRAAAEPALEAAMASRVAALFMFGQTGSGKTFTMQAFESRLATALFDDDAQNDDDRQRVAIRYFEIKGKKAFDLLSSSSGEYSDENEIKLVDDEATCLTVGASVAVPTSEKEFSEALAAGKKRRATAATDVNGGSSRSHAVLRVDLSGGGSLMLIDCAGSERSHDSMYHDAERRKESAEINQSIYALKSCIRASNAAKRWRERGGARDTLTSNGAQAPPPPPFRSSALTRVLREAFESRDSHVTVVATLSPAATDADHSVTTLTTVAQLAGLTDKQLADCSPHPTIVPRVVSSRRGSKAPRVGHAFDDPALLEKTQIRLGGGRRPLAAKNDQTTRTRTPPRNWSTADLKAFLERRDERAANRLDGTDLDGRNVVRMSPAAVAAALTDNDLDRATAILNALRDEAARCDNRRAVDRARRSSEASSSKSSKSISKSSSRTKAPSLGGRLPPFAFT